MSLFYIKLFGWDWDKSKPNNQPPQLTSEPSKTESEPQGSDRVSQNKVSEENRHVQKNYYLERRFLL